MSGTWLQSGTYGPHPGHNGPPAAGLTAEALLQALRSLPAVALARKSKCEWVVATTLFAHKPAQLRPPASHPTTAPPHCWLAFVDTLEHHTPGWTAVKLALFPDLERNQNIVKVALPVALERPALYVDYTITRARCIALPWLVRAPELTPSARAMHPVQLLASKIPWWSSRSRPDVQLDLTRSFVAKSKRSADRAELDDLEERMRRAKYNVSATHQGTVPDSVFMVWPEPDEPTLRFSRFWFEEVALHSAFEKASYGATTVPAHAHASPHTIYLRNKQSCCQAGWLRKCRTFAAITIGPTTFTRLRAVANAPTAPRSPTRRRATARTLRPKRASAWLQARGALSAWH